MRWRLKNYGEFDTCSFYGVLRGPFVPIPWKGILGVKVPRQVSFVVWKAARGRFLLVTIFEGEDILQWIGVACATVVGRGWITFDSFHRCLSFVEFCFKIFCYFLGLTKEGERYFICQRNQLGKHSSDIWNLVSLCLIFGIWSAMFDVDYLAKVE